MSNQTTDTSSPIRLSEGAANAIRKIIAEQDLPVDKTSLRVGVKGGGCSGFNYVLDLVEEEPGESDEVLESQGIKIVVDSRSLLYLTGVEIDYKDEVYQSGFTFKNPNATSTCGCGHSFSA